jgi:hypothetical protein
MAWKLMWPILMQIPLLLYHGRGRTEENHVSHTLLPLKIGICWEPGTESRDGMTFLLSGRMFSRFVNLWDAEYNPVSSCILLRHLFAFTYWRYGYDKIEAVVTLQSGGTHLITSFSYLTRKRDMLYHRNFVRLPNANFSTESSIFTKLDVGTMSFDATSATYDTF